MKTKKKLMLLKQVGDSWEYVPSGTEVQNKVEAEKELRNDLTPGKYAYVWPCVSGTVSEVETVKREVTLT